MKTSNPTFRPVESREVYIEDLWRMGIPVKIRKVLWPFKIDNKLGISNELYIEHLEQGLKLKKQIIHKYE